jgi:hypothetical protein
MPIPKIVVTAALMAAQVAIGMSRRFEGPRLDTLKTTTAEYGTPIPRFWGTRKFECPVIWAEDLREKKKTSKGKAGKQTSYNYYATFAFLICDHQIEAVSKIWFDNKLVYDATNAGPTSLANFLSGFAGRTLSSQNMRIYLGTEDQLPDPRMEAWCEDRYGADSCPAYRGSSYVVIEDMPVNNFGNRIPNITVEAMSLADTNRPYETRTTALDTSSRWAFGGGLGAYVDSSGTVEWWEAPTRTRLGLSPSASLHTGNLGYHDVSNTGTAYFCGTVLVPTTRYFISCSPLAPPVMTEITTTNTFSHTRVVGDSVYTAFSNATGYVSSATVVPHTLSCVDFAPDEDGDHWGLFQPMGSSDSFTLERLDGSTSHDFTGLVVRAGPNSARLTFYNGKAFVHGGDGHFYIVDPVTGNVDDSGVAAWSLPFFRHDGSGVFWVNGDKFSLTDGSTLQNNNLDDWVGATHLAGQYDPVTHAMWERNSPTTSINILYLDRIESSPVTLATVVDDVSDWVGLSGQDTSQLTQPVHGYSVSQGSGKDMLDPLLTVHDVDARPHDHSIQFLVRGAAPSLTLLTEDFVRENGPRYTVTIEQDTDLPAGMSVNFADMNADQSPNTIRSQRVADAMDSSRQETIDLSTYATTPDEAQQLSDRCLRRVWNERENLKLSLTAQELILEPGDVRFISLDGEVRPARLKKLTIKQLALDTEWVRSEPSLHTLNGATGAAQEGRDPDILVFPALSKGFALDIPLITDGDNDINPILYVAAGGYADPYAGTIFLRGDDGSYDEEFGAVNADQEATWGLTTNTLGAANPNLWDRGNSINVTLLNGTLTSSSEAAINEDPTLNLAVIGADDRWEIINFATATLEADGTYTLSGFKRGRRGTEGHVATHVVGDSFILLSGALKKEMGADDIGDDLSFKAVSLGRSEEQTEAIDIEFDANSLRPYAPARVIWSTDGTDLFGEIIRRTRVGGSWSGDGVVPLSENSEAYEVDVMDGVDVVRTITVTGTNEFTYSGANLTADGFSLTNRPDVNVYQMSDAVGRGFTLAA